MDYQQSTPTVPGKDLPQTPPIATTAKNAASEMADRTAVRHVPRTRVATSRHPRVRWWRIACDHLWRLVMDPVVEWSTPEFRGVDILETTGIRFDRVSGAISSYVLTRRGRWLYRNHDVYQDYLLVGGHPGTGWIGLLIFTHAAQWAQLAGMPPEHIRQQWNRLLKVLAQRWEADGTEQRLWRTIERALALDHEVLRLVRATAHRLLDPDGVFMSDYQRCLSDRANLLTVEREAPQLLRLYTMLLPNGAGMVEPKLALKQAFLDGDQRPPRLWRTMCRFDQATLDALTAPGQCVYMPPLADWIDFLQALDLPCQPPAEWMFGLRQSFGDSALSRDFAVPWARPVFMAHLIAWMAADESARITLFIELEDFCEVLLNLAKPPKALPELRSWRACIRWAARMQRAQFESEAEAARAWDAARGLPRERPSPPLRAARIELRRLLTSHALYEEGRAMKNCIHDWRDDLVDNTAAIYSVYLARTGEHIGTTAITLYGQIEFRGPNNGSPIPEHRREVMLLLRREHTSPSQRRMALTIDGDVSPLTLEPRPMALVP